MCHGSQIVYALISNGLMEQIVGPLKKILAKVEASRGVRCKDLVGKSVCRKRRQICATSLSFPNNIWCRTTDSPSSLFLLHHLLRIVMITVSLKWLRWLFSAVLYNFE